MPRRRYRTIAIPEDLYEKCEQVVKSGDLGYSSVSEFVKEAIRKRLEELKII